MVLFDFSGAEEEQDIETYTQQLMDILDKNG